MHRALRKRRYTFVYARLAVCMSFYAPWSTNHGTQTRARGPALVAALGFALQAKDTHLVRNVTGSARAPLHHVDLRACGLPASSMR